MSSAVAIILARAGSKGVPGKNLADIAGRSSIEWTIRAALETVPNTSVFVSSDASPALAIAYVAASNILGITLLLAGMWLARQA